MNTKIYNRRRELYDRTQVTRTIDKKGREVRMDGCVCERGMRVQQTVQREKCLSFVDLNRELFI